MGSRYSIAPDDGGIAWRRCSHGVLGATQAQQPCRRAIRAGARDAQGGSGADLAYGLFAAADANTDGAVTKAEFKETFEKWFSDRGHRQDRRRRRGGAPGGVEAAAAPSSVRQPRAGDARRAARPRGRQAQPTA